MRIRAMSNTQLAEHYAYLEAGWAHDFIGPVDDDRALWEHHVIEAAARVRSLQLEGRRQIPGSDPDYLLQTIRGLIFELREALPAGDDGEYDLARDLACDALEYVEVLDDHLCQAGALPAAWKGTQS